MLQARSSRGVTAETNIKRFLSKTSKGNGSKEEMTQHAFFYSLPENWSIINSARHPMRTQFGSLTYRKIKEGHVKRVRRGLLNQRR